MLTGGPGTGKTTTVAGLLALLLEQHARPVAPLRIALAAPTGKAAARLQQAVHESTRRPALDDRPTGTGSTASASTLHRLLGWRPDSRSASATTAATGCPTTWSSSTSPRWSR